MKHTSDDFAGNIERFSGFADLYDKYRPEPPDVLSLMLIQQAQTTFPDCIVEFGVWDWPFNPILGR